MTVKELLEPFDLKTSEIDEVDLYDIEEGEDYEFFSSKELQDGLNEFGYRRVKSYFVQTYEGKRIFSICFK